ncbi:serine/threonine-protein kinase haspin-like [Tetranychus urticae]|uniref:non-specific serine/threonine protein kinase n=1 Tax=Tetranychus urticae TaxID=32264 RepID=T1KJP1_TETUR|nr:serine/threonine-protein kinase haspin-like [Tetranychus urticae]
METVKSPLKANYCRLPVKSRAEKLFDQFVTKTTFADRSNDLNLLSQDSPTNHKEVKTRLKRKVTFATYAGDKQRKEVKKKTLVKRKEPTKCTKEAVLEAFMNAGLPDYDEIAALPLNIVVLSDANKQPEKYTEISRKQIVKPFMPLLKKIDSASKRKESNPAINIEEPSCADNEVSSDHIEDRENKEEASTPLPNAKARPKFDDISCINANNTLDPNMDQDVSFTTPKVPPPAKKKPWNVADRRGTQLLPPHPVVFDEPLVISNTSIDVSNDQPLNWSTVHSLAKMDDSVHNVFSIDTKANLATKIRESLGSLKSNMNEAEYPRGSVNFYRRSIVDTANVLRALGKSCRTIVREPSRRITRKRKESLAENQTVNFLVAFDKTIIEDVDVHLPLTTKEKVLALCNPPQITTFNNVLNHSLMKSICKIGEGSYGEVFKSKTEDDKEVVIKVVPLVPTTSVEDDLWAQVLPELVISLTFSDLRSGLRNQTPNFVNTFRASCVNGSWPKELVKAWNEYNKLKKSENDHPDKYGPNCNWLIILLNNGGIDLENHKFSSAVESLSVILQTALSLAAAESEFEFEHRDLHTGNVLIMPCSESMLEYKIDGKNIMLPSVGLKVSVIDFTLARMAKDGYTVYDDLSKYEDLFTGTGDYQFEIYRLMRIANKNNWKVFTPYTNILWVHYLTYKLTKDKKYRSRSKAHHAAMKALKHLHNLLLDYKSTKQFVQSPYFNELFSKLS